MEYEAAAGYCFREGGGIAKITGYGFYIQLRNFAASADQRPNVMAALCKQARHVPSDETGRAGNQCGLQAIYRSASVAFTKVARAISGK
jgi:hypothetical protein